MISLRPILTLALVLLAAPGVLWAQYLPGWEIKPLHEGELEWDLKTGIISYTNGVLVKYGDAVLTAERAAVNQATYEVLADGDVRVQQGDQIWASEHMRYNFRTHQIESRQFRTGQLPVFAAGEDLQGDITNRVYNATNAIVTTEDTSEPIVKVRAKRITVIPGKRILAHGATLYVRGVPVFYFPYYSRNLGEHANNWNATPGYRSLYGPYLLATYSWWLNDQLDGELHLDYRDKRGPGAGPDVNYNFGRWGEGGLRYYYTHDRNSEIDGLGVPIAADRQRVWFSYQSMPQTNLAVKGLVRYESDPAVVRDFFEGEYRRNLQPNTFFEVNKFWRNFSLDTYVEPRVNRFLEVVQRLPDVRLTGYRQQLGETPLYYESESSVGYYSRVFAVDPGTNSPASGPNGAPRGLDYAAGRADTYHQILLPETFFGWLNVTPRVGGRFTHYTEASGPGSITDEEDRGVFNTGIEVNFKASRVWRDAQNQFFEVDGLRHIVEPSANYVYVPSPSTPAKQLPQFDFELPALRLLPIEFPDNNNIDSIDSQNVIRWGVRNRLQTKRDDKIVNLVNWSVYTDWRIKPRSDQTTFSDLYSDMTLRPRSWLLLESIIRYDIHGGDWRMSYHTLTFKPNNVWSWSLGHFYLRDDLSPSPLALGIGNNVFTSALMYRLNENWGLRASHYFEARTGDLREQNYSVYRDLRSATAALSLQVRDNPTGPYDWGVAFTFSLKLSPRLPLGADVVHPYSLLED